MAVRSPEPARRGSPPCIAVAGEARSGKSSLINVLLGSSVLPTGFNDHIPLPVLVSYASRLSLSLELSNGRRVPTDWLATGPTATHNIRRLRLGLPIDLLKTCRLVEAAGFATGCDDLDRRSLGICRRAHSVVWCTPAVQAWKASERDAWLMLPKRLRERSILAVTYKDAIPSERDAEQLSARLRAEAGPYFSKIVMIANNRAAALGGQPDGPNTKHPLQASGGAEICAAVRALIAEARP